ncbi:hypothetical protein [Burkholderia ubonensis]|uniref:hypothetical protein n=1 Tax=Burkholderia ubonensis TaxID=101571 RepID=UPI0012F7B583|nr:hypothetical protein [Burkholderia ubonensis]
MEDRTARFGLDPFRGQPLQLWQGTVLESKDGEMSRRKLVVSADCDLTDAKGNGEFFTLDVVDAGRYLRHLVLEDARGDFEKILLQSVRDTAINRSPKFSSVSDHVILEWLTTSTEDRWEADLPGLHANERDWLNAIRELIGRLPNGKLTQPSPTSNMKELALLLVCKNSQLESKVISLNKRIKEALLKRLQPSRVDLYIFPSFPGDSDAGGHVVPFKSLALMKRDQVCMRRGDLIDNPGGLVPVATCRPILLQSLLQKMTTYFIRIGLTDSFSSEQQNVAKNLVESLR